jgi:hypothetical protein
MIIGDSILMFEYQRVFFSFEQGMKDFQKR